MPVSDWRMGSRNHMYGYILWGQVPKKPMKVNVVTENPLLPKKKAVKPRKKVK